MFIAIDLKSFYASVECADRGLDPLTANLVVADPTRTEKTICLAVSPSLKAYGIPGRARLFEVQQKLGEIGRRTGREVEYLIAQPRMARYVEVSAQIYGIYLDFVSPEDIHVYSIDECFIDAAHYLRLYGMSAREMAVMMVRKVLKETGITATAGIGTNLYLSKIAMDIVAKHAAADADGVRIAELDEDSYRRLLWDYRPITDFWRIGRGTARRLEQAGIYTMGDIARISVYNAEILYRMFGIDAEILIDHAWGYEPCTMADIKAYRPQTSCISSGQVLPRPYEYQKARLIVREMADQAALELVERGEATDSLTLTVGYDRCAVDAGTYRGEIHIDHYGRRVPKSAHGTARLDAATSSAGKIIRAVLELFDRIVNPELMVRRVTLCANDLRREESYEQMTLFSDPGEDARERKMQETMLSIKKRYGKNAVLKGMNLEEGATAMERNGQIGGHRA